MGNLFLWLLLGIVVMVMAKGSKILQLQTTRRGNWVVVKSVSKLHNLALTSAWWC